MSVGDELTDRSTTTDRDPVEGRWRRFLLASFVFLAYETLCLLVFRGDFGWVPEWGESGLGWLAIAILLIGPPALGYLAYGAFAGSLLSGLVLLLPIFIALALDGTTPSNDETGEAWPLYATWFFYSIIFLPAWMLGAFAAALAAQDDGAPT
jgi:hypothetical protein